MQRFKGCGWMQRFKGCGWMQRIHLWARLQPCWISSRAEARPTRGCGCSDSEDVDGCSDSKDVDGCSDSKDVDGCSVFTCGQGFSLAGYPVGLKPDPQEDADAVIQRMWIDAAIQRMWMDAAIQRMWMDAAYSLVGKASALLDIQSG